MTNDHANFRFVSNLFSLAILSLFTFTIIAQAQPEFSESEYRLIRQNGVLSDGLKHKLPQEKFSMPEISRQSRAAFADGNIDPTFNAAMTEGFGYVNETVVQTDGKIIAVGLFHKANGTRVTGIARFNADGTLDTSFDIGTGVNGAIRAVVLQSDGKIIIGGAFSTFNGQSVNKIVRLNSDGSRDFSFNLATTIGGQINDILILPNGKLMIGGTFIISGSRLMRLDSDGMFETAIGNFNGAVHTLALAPDGKIVVGGQFSMPYRGIVRLEADGNIDPTFNPTTSSQTFAVYETIVQPDGKILIAGQFTGYNGTATDSLVRLNTDGSLDTAFEIIKDSNINFAIDGLALQPDGKILVGFFDTGAVSFADVRRFNADGMPDPTFNTNSGNTLSVFNLNLLADGKILAGGFFIEFNNEPRLRLVKLNTDGSLDTAFDPAVSAAGSVYAIKRQTDGKILVGGDFRYVNGVKKRNIARLNSDGSLDSTFDVGAGIFGDVYAVEVQPDGKIILGGLFSGDLTFPASVAARVNSDGSLDVNLNDSSDRFITNAYDIALQPDGKILIAGLVFLNIPTFRTTFATRVNPDGNVDMTFNPPTVSNGGRALLVQPDGKIIVGGIFSPAGGPTPLQYRHRQNKQRWKSRRWIFR